MEILGWIPPDFQERVLQDSIAWKERHNKEHISARKEHSTIRNFLLTLSTVQPVQLEAFAELALLLLEAE